MEPERLVTGVIQYVALLLALCVHEFSHGATALWLGDRTAEGEGRLTLNPIVHVDPVGTVLFPLLGLFTALPLFGWARPVPVQPANFRRGWFGRGQVLTAAAGPLSNVAQALVWLVVHALLTRLVTDRQAAGTPLEAFSLFVLFSIQINLILAAFNMIPVPPLDGAHIASWSLPRHLAEKYDAFMEPYGFFVLIILVVTPILGFFLWPVVHGARWATALVGAW